MNRTDIEYLTHTWNPIAMRCTPISEGCANCWHQRMANRLAGNKNFPEDIRKAYACEGPPVLVESRLTDPMVQKEPARIGVQFMGDLFNENVPDEFISSVFQVMYECPQHIFQVLTKRPQRMYDFISTGRYLRDGIHPIGWIWLGVSVENQAAADERIPLLLQTPAAVRFVSLEPLLGPVDLTKLEHDGLYYNALSYDTRWIMQVQPRARLDWVILGGESGPGATPMHPDWARSVRDQCQAAGVPFFFKSWGAWFPRSQWEDNPDLILPDDDYKGPNLRIIDDEIMHRVGKKRGGRLLDGQLWEEYPR